jgi:AraC-like DNA-binding protein
MHQGQFFKFPAKINDLEKIDLQSKSLLMKSGANEVFLKTFILKKDIRLLCTKYKPADDFHLHKLPSFHGFFILRIDDITCCNNRVIMVDRKYKNMIFSKDLSVILLSSADEFTFFAPKNSHVKTLEIFIPYELFLERTNVECSYDFLRNYLVHKTKKVQPGANNNLFKKIFHEILDHANSNNLSLTFMDKKINSLLSEVFSNLSSDLNSFFECQKVKISDDEIKRLITVREILDTIQQPPTFTSLTKVALMSGTSLKTKFKKMYGTTVFEYYQRIRMQRARILLLSRRYSIKQIGRQLGYSNLSNFAIAFRKEFDQLPHELIKQI